VENTPNKKQPMLFNSGVNTPNKELPNLKVSGSVPDVQRRGADLGSAGQMQQNGKS